MVAAGDADALVVGENQHYPDAIKPAMRVIGAEPGKAVAGIYMMVFQGETIFLADCTVNIDPDSQRLKQIALATGTFVRNLGIEPRIAMLSFSNFGSVKHPASRKVWEAVAMLHAEYPQLAVDGEILGVVATNALELGIDIGSLDVVVMAGYPGTIASTWQRAGRAGRRSGSSCAIFVASSAPLDQFIVQHPEYFFGKPSETDARHRFTEAHPAMVIPLSITAIISVVIGLYPDFFMTFAKAVLPRIPARRWGSWGDFGGIAVYLMSEASAYHTGEQFVIDGGYTIG